MDEIEAVLQDFYTNPHPYRMLRKFDLERSAYLYRMVTKGPPEDLPLMVGDCVHNMRSALDHVIWALALQRRPNPDRMITFPLSATPEQWDTWKNRFRKQVPPKAFTAIEELQVHERPQPALEPAVRLHLLDRDDKHKLVLTVNSSQQTTEVAAGYRINGDAVVRAASVLIGPIDNDTTEVASFELVDALGRPLTKDPEVDMKPDISLCVGFAKDSPAVGECVDILLLKCLNYVDSVFAKVDPFLGR